MEKFTASPKEQFISYNTEREMSKDVLRDISAHFYHLARKEKLIKDITNGSRVRYYEIVAHSFGLEWGKFRYSNCTPEYVEYVFNELCPLLKKINLLTDKSELPIILVDHSVAINNMIDKYCKHITDSAIIPEYKDNIQYK